MSNYDKRWESRRKRQPESPDTCFVCEHCKLCFLRRWVSELLSAGMINMDGGPAVRPRKYIDIFEALGSACLEYAEHTPEKQKTP